MAGAAPTVSRGTIVIDTTPLRKLAGVLRAAAPDAARTMRLALKTAGGIVAVEAAARASWSETIPGSIRVQTAGTTVKVTAGKGLSSPIATLYENGGEPGSWRHPVWGNTDNWVSQQARPFLAPALEAKSEEVAAAAGDAIAEGWRALGLDVL